ncbi:N-acyl-D-amino-acid deacylase family protein [Chelatococcus reniformis]|uniref:Amidohydrolase n=1 Tax=Chelatococcus reniformis TaxID=1494448 RepID=A0A916TXZ7_9HYPH|nr:amidohydrolase family protein [Chelatococcus reniformis]GGC48753.1 amidohydrolase [Chelatococcus reniformis]
MAKDYDLVIRHGTVVDGSGGPAFEADVAIRGGRIAEVGRVTGAGAEEIDAKGQLVTPGFVDIHTHYDGQAVWDRHLAPSAWHGATTVVMGNCGVGFAPVKPNDRDKLIALMEGVEDIPAPCLAEGLDFNWESFADFLDVVAARQRDIDVCAQLPHAAVRVYVMGERALRLENATPTDVARMRHIVTEAIRAGAFGVSTSRTINHKTLAGDPTPTLKAQEDEILGLAMGLADAGRGHLQLITDFNQPDAETEFAMLRRVVEKSRRPCLFSLFQKHDRPEDFRKLLALAGEASREGHIMRPVFPPRPISVLFGLTSSLNPFSGTQAYKTIADKPFAERLATMRNPEFRAKVLGEDLSKGNVPLLRALNYKRLFLLDDNPNYEPAEENSIAAIAAREGRSAPEVAYDLIVGGDGTDFLLFTILNYADYNLAPSREMLSDANAIMGLGDGGAHVGFICDGSFQSYLLSWWGRDRPSGRLPVEECVRRLTSDTAHAVGLHDRGLLRVGLRADVNVIDFDRLAIEKPFIRADLPAGGRRFLQRARGYTATVVAGQVTYRNGEATGLLPGALVRGPQPAPAALAQGVAAE